MAECEVCKEKMRCGLQCGECEEWFHFICAKVAIRDEENWTCTVCSKRLEEEEGRIAELEAELKEAREKIKRLESENGRLKAAKLSSGASQLTCSGDAESGHRWSISITNKRNESGEWVTWFSTSQNTSVMPKNVDLDLTRTFDKCQGNHFINIQGIIQDTTQEDERKSLYFHNKCSSDAAITNNGRTLQKIKLDGQGSALTYRPLLDDEIFTIRLDIKDTKLEHGMGIGITIHSPETLDIPNHMNSLRSGTWIFFQNNLYHNSVVASPKYENTHLGDVKVGQRIGVMRSRRGSLHFFLDGVDQGPAASNIPEKVYGVFELFGDALQGTIVDS